jgi:ABC-type antimicrobial peptide transport system permease subunit
VRRYVLRQGLTIGALGVTIGLVGAVLAGRVVESLLFGVSTLDPLVLSATGAALIAATFAASILPARQALRTDPFLVMRSD